MSESDAPSIEGIAFVDYVNEEQLDDVMRLVAQDLSEPYSIFTYRYFLHHWPQLCILAVPTKDNNLIGKTTRTNNIEECNKKSHDNPTNKSQAVEDVRRPIGCIVCKTDCESDREVGDNKAIEIDGYSTDDAHGALGGQKIYTGYIGMLAVEQAYRRSGIGAALVHRVIQRMQRLGCTSILLETEVSNKGAIRLYEDRFGFLREELLVKYYLNWGDAFRLRLWLDT